MTRIRVHVHAGAVVIAGERGGHRQWRLPHTRGGEKGEGRRSDGGLFSRKKKGSVRSTHSKAKRRTRCNVKTRPQNRDVRRMNVLEMLEREEARVCEWL